MRFLLLNQFYPPDVAPTGKYLHDLAQTLAQRGHQVKVLCSRRSYDGGKSFPRREMLDGIEVNRLPATGFGRRGFIGKILDYASFYGALFAALMLTRKPPEMILSLTTPPFIGLLGKLAAKRHGCSHAHWVMDLYPDVMFAHGMAHNNGFLPRLLRSLTRFQYRGAEFIVALGPTTAERVASYVRGRTSKANQRYLKFVLAESLTRPETTFSPSDGERVGMRGIFPKLRDIFSRSSMVESNGRRSVVNMQNSQPSAINPQLSTVLWIPLWGDPKLNLWPENKPNPLRIERGWGANDVVFMYSGNMGLGHRFSEFLEAAQRMGSSGPRWVFAGGGKRMSEIEAFSKSHPSAAIKILDYAPQASLRAHLCAADVHLASLDSAWQGLMVPSKLQSSFAVGRPVLYVGGRENETAAWIQDSGGGWVVDEGDMDGLLSVITLALNADERRKRGQAAREFAHQHFQMSANCVRIAQLLEGGVEEPREDNLTEATSKIHPRF